MKLFKLGECYDPVNQLFLSVDMSLNHGSTEVFKLIQITFAILGKGKFTVTRRVFTVTHPSTNPVQLPVPKLIKGLGTSVHIVKITSYQKNNPTRNIS